MFVTPHIFVSDEYNSKLKYSQYGCESFEFELYDLIHKDVIADRIVCLYGKNAIETVLYYFIRRIYTQYGKLKPKQVFDFVNSKIPINISALRNIKTDIRNIPKLKRVRWAKNLTEIL